MFVSPFRCYNCKKQHNQQAWIGYEIGVSKGADRATGKLKQEEYFAQRIVVVEDVPQAVEVCVPYLHLLCM